MSPPWVPDEPRRDEFDIAGELLRIRERGHNHENRIASLELRSEYQTALMKKIETKLDSFGDVLAQVAKRGEIEAAIDEVRREGEIEKRAAVASRDVKWMRRLTLPQRALVWFAVTAGAVVVIANAVRGMLTLLH